ncbi:hypothetical protein [Asticcacaulis sp. AC466]|uniref:hypothetical protein n=1 Tax=Asticcacaulis sp. AC466 TaxID=1282362 RepID=UPI0012DBEDD0|nr:hypothetical protein [Asticcacaulis sp. AC466]
MSDTDPFMSKQSRMTSAFVKAFPAALGSVAEEVIRALRLPTDHVPGYFHVQVCGEPVTIPYRVYPPVLNPTLGGQTPVHRQLARCILTRSANGFERQAALQDVLTIHTPWAIPFVIALIGDYVVQIIDDINTAMPHIDPVLIARLIAENPDFYEVTRARVMSYWDCYYRDAFDKADYPGFQVLAKLDAIVKARKHQIGTRSNGEDRPAIAAPDGAPE